MNKIRVIYRFQCAPPQQAIYYIENYDNDESNIMTFVWFSLTHMNIIRNYVSIIMEQGTWRKYVNKNTRKKQLMKVRINL